MDSPVLTAGEEGAINAAIEAIKVSQAARDKPVQVLMNDTNGILSLGVPENIVAASAPAGFSFQVDELKNAQNVRGWRLIITLVREGSSWTFEHEEFGGVPSETGWVETSGAGLPWL